jgi:hypothetical protein
MTSITGGCLCGAVRYQLTAAPIVARVCWCRLCQYLAAGNGTVNVCFPSAALTVQGAVTEFRSIADSGTVMRRSFCPVCGTPLLSAAESRPHLVFVRAGSLDDREVARPAMTIWAAQAPTWAAIDSRLPREDAQPPPAA